MSKCWAGDKEGGDTGSGVCCRGGLFRSVVFQNITLDINSCGDSTVNWLVCVCLFNIHKALFANLSRATWELEDRRILNVV